jgi:SAM-dependent methyltransferase
MKDHPFKCLECGKAPLEQGGGGYRCSRCGTNYQELFGVPLFLKGARVSRSAPLLSAEAAAAICRDAPSILGAAADETKAGVLQDILSYHYDFPSSHLAAENNYFLDRVPLPDHLKRPRPTARCPDLPVNENVRYRIVSHLVPEALPRATLLTRNVRLENVGASIISSKVAPAVWLSYRWRSPAGALLADGERTVLPVDLLPGRAITVPTVLRTPRAAGPAVLELALRQEGGRWLGDSFGLGVNIVAGRLTAPAHWARLPPGQYDYSHDHEKGRGRLKEEVARRHHPEMRALELGGCCNPMARGLDADVYVVDVDVQTLQVGQALVRQPGERLYFVAADAHDLPFADGSFDAITMFASLHHFADPIELLTKLRRLLRRNGFLAIMCEPCGTYLNGQADAGVLRELERGINEQVFSLEEYHYMFQRAGLYSPWATVEGPSFKAILQAEPGPDTLQAPRTTRWPWSRLWRHLRRSA